MQNTLQTNGGDGLASLQFINVTNSMMSETLGEAQTSFLPVKHEAQKRRAIEAGLHANDDSDSDDGMGMDGREVVSSHQPNVSGPTDGPKPGKKTKGRVKIKMEFIENKLRRYTTFSKRKTGIMKKAYELSTLTGTQVMLLVASETGHVYTFATRKLQPMITSESGKALIQTCLNSPDQPPPGSHNDQRMNPLGFEETELNYAISEDEAAVQKQQAVASMQYIGGPMAASSPESSSPSLQLTSTPQPAPSPPQLIPAPSIQPNRTIAMTTYLNAQSLSSSAAATSASSNSSSSGATSGMSMQLPTVPSAVTGAITAILPPAGLPPGAVTLSSLPGQSHVGGQQAIYRIPANMAAGQVLSQISIPGVGGASSGPGGGSTNTSGSKIDSFQSFLSGVISQGSQQQRQQQQQQQHSQQQQQQQQANSSTVGLPQPLTIVNTSTAGGTVSQGTVMYQTPQGLVYATPSTAVSGLPEGYILNLPQTPGLPTDQQTGGSTPQFITIPMQQVLQPILTAPTSEDQQRPAQSNLRK